MYSPFALDVPLCAAVFTTIWRHANPEPSRTESPLPFQVSVAGNLDRAFRMLLTSLTQNLISTLLSSVPLFEPLSLSSTASANNPAPGGAAVFCFAGTPLRGSWFLPLRGHPPRKQTLALGSCLTLAPSGWCALRDSGHQRRFFHVCIC